MTKNNQALLKVMGGTMAFSMTGVCVVAAGANPILFSGIRSLTAMLILGFAIRKSVLHRPTPRTLLLSFIAGVSTYCWVAAFVYTDPASVAALGYSFPVLIPFVRLMWGKKAKFSEWLLVGFIGVGLAIVFATAARSGARNIIIGDLLALAAALTWGLYLMGAEILTHKEKEVLPFWCQVPAVGIALLAIPLLHLQEMRGLTVTAMQWGVINGATVAVAVTLVTASTSLGATTVAIVSSSEIALTPIFMGLLLHRWPLAGSAVGAGIVFAVAVVAAIISKERKGGKAS